MLIPVIVSLSYQHIPKGCRNPRANVSQETALFEVAEVTAAEAPLICRARRTRGWSTGKPEEVEEGESSRSWMVWRRHGNACWKLTGDDVSKEVTGAAECCARSWESREKRFEPAMELMTKTGQLCAAGYLLVDGVAYERCEEPAWAISMKDYWSSPYEPSLEICDRGAESKLELFRLDEYAEARRRLRRNIGRKRPTRACLHRYPGASYKHRIGWTIAELDTAQLRRPKGMALVNGGRLEDIREAVAKVPTGAILALLTDYLPDLLPPGTDVAAARLLEALNVFHETMAGGATAAAANGTAASSAA